MFKISDLLLWLGERQKHMTKLRRGRHCWKIRKELLAKEVAYAVVEEYVREQAGYLHSWEEEEDDGQL